MRTKKLKIKYEKKRGLLDLAVKNSEQLVSSTLSFFTLNFFSYILDYIGLHCYKRVFC